MDLNSLEIETIGLCISLEALNDMVNHALLDVRESRNLGEPEVYFKDFVHRSLFLIRFLDFAKELGDSNLTGVSGSCINVLKEACQSKNYDNGGSVNDLERSIKKLQKWLDFKAPLKLWLPTLNIEAKIEISRMEFLEISGNYSKHNISRLTGISKRIQQTLSEHNYNVQIEFIPLALEDFQEHLDENYFIYYGTWMTQLLNNVRWGIQKYVKPTYISCLRQGADDFSYEYEYPKEFKNEIAKQWFWRLMNHIRTGPYVKRFSSPTILKERSSLEWEGVDNA